MIRVQPVEAIGQEPLLPAHDGRSGGLKSSLDRAEGESFGQHKNQLGAEDIAGRKRTGLSDSGKFVALGVAQGQMGGNRHTDIYASPALTVTLRHATRELIEDSVLHDRERTWTFRCTFQR